MLPLRSTKIGSKESGIPCIKRERTLAVNILNAAVRRSDVAVFVPCLAELISEGWQAGPNNHCAPLHFDAKALKNEQCRPDNGARSKYKGGGVFR